MHRSPLVIFIQRGPNAKSDAIGKAITTTDYHFDYRGKSWILLLMKAWITSTEIPYAKIYFIEGGLCFWPAWFLKRKYPSSRLILMVPEPAFYLDYRKSWLKKAVFYARMWLYRRTISGYMAVSEMVAADIARYCPQPVYVVPHFIHHPERFEALGPNGGRHLLFVCDRPAETGYVKGLQEVMDIFTILAERKPDIELWLVGTGTEYLPLTHSRIRGLGRVDLTHVIPECRVVVSPAKYDALNLAVAECVLGGMVPVVSAHVGSKEWINPVCSLLVVESENLLDYVNVIEQVYDWSESEYQHVVSQLKQKSRLLNEAMCIDKGRSAWHCLTENLL